MTSQGSGLTVAGIFAGIGGMELGLKRAGHTTVELCEIDPRAQAVLRQQFPGVAVSGDVRLMQSLPEVDVAVAGFPCQNLSQVGDTTGIRGGQSGVVDQFLSLLKRGPRPQWVLLENVPFMLFLHRGAAMEHLTGSLSRLGYTWAYRIVDTRAFGLPQRRRRVFIVASLDHDPREVLFADDAGPIEAQTPAALACGFYWTEGTKGLGWTVDATPTLKGGSAVGIPSPPAIWTPNGLIGVPDVRDGERLQGFPSGWTSASDSAGWRTLGWRWRLVGNAVSVPVAQWLGRRLAKRGRSVARSEDVLPVGARWPNSGWGVGQDRYAVSISEWPVTRRTRHLHEFLRYPLTSLSLRATSGFLSRARQSSLRFDERFWTALELHESALRECEQAAA